MNYMAINGLKAHPTKTVLRVMRTKGSTEGEQVTIRVDEVNVIKETVSERILGIQVSNKDQLSHCSAGSHKKSVVLRTDPN